MNAGGPGGRPHILAINDTPAILELFAAILESAGYLASTDLFAKDPAALLADVERLAPDAVVLDYLIGGEALGWQFLQMLKMHPPTAGIPVVICTAAVKQVEELRPHLDAQGIGVVLKPFDIGQLLAAVAEALARRPAAGGA